MGEVEIPGEVSTGFCEVVNPATQCECDLNRHDGPRHQHGAWIGGRRVLVEWEDGASGG